MCCYKSWDHRAPCCNKRCSCTACRHTPRRRSRGRVAGQRAVVQRAAIRPTAVGGRVAGQRAVVQRAARRPTAEPLAELPVSVQLYSVLSYAPPPPGWPSCRSACSCTACRQTPHRRRGRVAGQRAVVQRAAIRPTATVSSRPSCRSACSCRACRQYAPPPKQAELPVRMQLDTIPCAESQYMPPPKPELSS